MLTVVDRIGRPRHVNAFQLMPTTPILRVWKSFEVLLHSMGNAYGVFAIRTKSP